MLKLNSINVHSNIRHSSHCKSENRLAVSVILETFLTVYRGFNKNTSSGFEYIYRLYKQVPFFWGVLGAYSLRQF